MCGLNAVIPVWRGRHLAFRAGGVCLALHTHMHTRTHAHALTHTHTYAHAHMHVNRETGCVASVIAHSVAAGNLGEGLLLWRKWGRVAAKQRLPLCPGQPRLACERKSTEKEPTSSS